MLICTYNAENYIHATLRSVFSQTYKNIKIYIWDDSSSDATIKIIKSFCDDRIFLIQSEQNIGPYKGLNKLLKYVKEDFIAIQDHDDLRHPQKIELQLDFKETGSVCWLRYYEFNIFGKKGLYTPWKFPNESYYCPHTTLMFRNTGFRYDTDLLFLSDSYSMRYNLCKNEKKNY